MKKTSLSLAIALSLSAGAAQAGGRGDLISLEMPTQRLIVRTEQTVATPNMLSFNQAMTAQIDIDLSYIRGLALANSYLYELPSFKNQTEIDAYIEKLQSMPGVLSVEEDVFMYPMSVNDPQYSNQWHYFESTGGINLEKAWEKSTGEGVYVAVIDTGITNHDDLNANIIGGYDFIANTSRANDGNGRDADPSDPGDWTSSGYCYSGSPSNNSTWHGTHVAGTVAAVTNNNVGVAGVAYNAKVVPLRVLGRCGGTTSDIADAIVWASGGSVSGAPNNPYPAAVINLSLGGHFKCGTYGTYQGAIDQAVANGSTIVVAAGNFNDNANDYAPASCDNIITVAATNRSGGRASYSNYGTVVDIAAPGGDSSYRVLSTFNSGTTTPGSQSYAYYKGTSMATPHVAGVIALMKSVAPNATPAQIKAAIEKTARPFPATCNQCGAGIIDAYAAINEITGNPGDDGKDDAPDAETKGSFNKTNLSASTGNWQHFNFTVPTGAKSLTVKIDGGTGDADLYLRKGSQPTQSSFDCRPYINGSNETCSVSSDVPATWYVGIRAYSEFSGLSLEANWE